MYVHQRHTWDVMERHSLQGGSQQCAGLYCALGVQLGSLFSTANDMYHDLAFELLLQGAQRDLASTQDHVVHRKDFGLVCVCVCVCVDVSASVCEVKSETEQAWSALTLPFTVM